MPGELYVFEYLFLASVTEALGNPGCAGGCGLGRRIPSRIPCFVSCAVTRFFFFLLYDDELPYTQM
jgi:hypothetical protein